MQCKEVTLHTVKVEIFAVWKFFAHFAQPEASANIKACEYVCMTCVLVVAALILRN